MSPRKKVLFIQHRMGDGGVTYSLASLLHFLTIERNWDITLLLRFRDNSPRMDLIPKGINQVWFDNCSEDFFATSYDVVIAYMPDMADILDKFRHVGRRIIWVHGDYSGFNDEIKSHIANCIKKADSVITPSRKASASIIDLVPEYRQQTVTIPHTIQVEKIKKLSADEVNDWPTSPDLSVLTVGKLLYNAKGLDRMIRVHRRLRDEGVNFQWVVIGDGPDREWIEKLIIENELQNTFLLLGFRQNPYPYMQKADIFAILSYHEGYCLVLNEAKILGRPIIATDFAGASDQIDNLYNGLVVENSEEGIYQGLKRILQAAPLRKQFSDHLKNYQHPNGEIIHRIEEVFFPKQMRIMKMIRSSFLSRNIFHLLFKRQC